MQRFHIFLATSNEPFYLTPIIRTTVSQCKHNIEGIILLSPISTNSSWIKTAKRFFDLYGFLHFLRTSLLFTLAKIIDRFPLPLNEKKL